MKALLIGFDDEDSQSVFKLVESQISNYSYYKCKIKDDLVEVLTSDGPFSYIVMNIDSKYFNPIDYYETINDLIGQRPFIFLGTIISIKSKLNQELVNNQKVNFIHEVPFTPQQVKGSIFQCEIWIKNEEFEQSIQEFQREEMRALRIKNFFLFDQLPYDVYIELTPSKYGKIISQNKFYSHQLVHSYSRKNIKYLYLKKDEHLGLLDQSIKNLINNYKTRNYDRSKIVKFHLKTIFFIQEFLKTLSVTNEIVELIKLLTESISNTVRSQKSFLNLLLEFDQSEQMNCSEVSLLSAYLCEAVICDMGWNADMTKGKLIIAAILQDIYLNNDELMKVRSLNDPLLKQFTEEEQEAFKEHPIKAGELARLFNGFSDLDFIIQEHHEHPHGEGFPVGLNSSTLTTISCVFIVVNHLISRIIRAEEGLVVQREIIASMRKVYSLGNFKFPMKSLSRVLS